MTTQWCSFFFFILLTVMIKFTILFKNISQIVFSSRPLDVPTVIIIIIINLSRYRSISLYNFPFYPFSQPSQTLQKKKKIIPFWWCFIAQFGLSIRHCFCDEKINKYLLLEIVLSTCSSSTINIHFIVRRLCLLRRRRHHFEFRVLYLVIKNMMCFFLCACVFVIFR